MGLCSAKFNNDTQLTGKTVVITGGNAGIGKEVVKDLAQRGARVILACRNLEKANTAAQDIKEQTGKDVYVRHIDMTSLHSIKEFANQLLRAENKIHILINNAGVLCKSRETTVDGFEMQFGVNHLGHFYLTHLLLDRIKESAPARIINVASWGHNMGKMHFEDLQLEKGFSGYNGYFQSKLANVLFTKELARRLQGTNVNTYAVHPGFIDSGLYHNDLPGMPCYRFFRRMFWKTTVQGAQTIIYCAVDEKLDNESGLYYSECKQTTPSGRARNSEDALKLWDISRELIGLEGNGQPFKKNKDSFDSEDVSLISPS